MRCIGGPKHGVDVNAICNQFGGGGHMKAAGCKLDGPMEVTIAPSDK